MTVGMCAVPKCGERDVCAAGDAQLCYPHFREMWDAIGPVSRWPEREAAMRKWLEVVRQEPQRRGA